MDEDVGHSRRVEQFSRTEEAVGVVSKAAIELMDEAWQTASGIVTELSSMKLRLPERKTSERHYFVLEGPNRLALHLHFSSPYTNSIDGTQLAMRILRVKDDWEPDSKTEILEEYVLRPTFDKQMKVLWTDSSVTFATGAALLDFALEKFVATLSVAINL